MTDISSHKSKMEVLCKYFYWKLQIPWNHDIVQCNCYSLILAPLIVCTPVLRVSMDGSDEEILWAIRKQLLWSASPVSEWSCFSVFWAGLAGLGWLGWAGLVYTDQSASWPGAAHLLWSSDVNSSSDLIPATPSSPLQLSTNFAEHNGRR